MFSAKLILSSFDFRRTFHQIWPLANSKLTEMNQDDLYVILLKSLYENNALELLPEVIDRLSLRSRNELFCSLVGLNKEKIMAFIRSALDQTAYGKHIAFSDIQLMAEENDDLSFSMVSLIASITHLTNSAPVTTSIGMWWKRLSLPTFNG